MESEELDSDELMEEGEEVVEEDTDDILGYLTPSTPTPTPTPPWLFDLLVGETPLLQVGLSDPGTETQQRRPSRRGGGGSLQKRLVRRWDVSGTYRRCVGVRWRSRGGG